MILHSIIRRKSALVEFREDREISHLSGDLGGDAEVGLVKCAVAPVEEAGIQRHRARAFSSRVVAGIPSVR